jgi:hypothetical protein
MLQLSSLLYAIKPYTIKPIVLSVSCAKCHS